MGGLLAAYVVALALAGMSHRYVIARELVRPPLLVFKATPVVCVVMLCFALLALVQYFRLYIRAKNDQSKPQSEVN